ncbi:5-carboxymethyl-2-hydroxymuconate Delta-isomerase [Aquibium carbonis]|uniref:5-carboxymethyl-2-hydroxymuconate Delta-isomerase n=1 Tax=Aquibium carbonis TaxID=2495581 RepID=A0A3R9YVJ2_9HYPH|nr:5-carboxymethyl-2-hydroxymuconate Delta-isomerase [Aquibium carbonis]RST88145.1 5-carboxymethyl-2-hydroxymuconate Delta-isomerase [Aquibium carbonis]
MPHLTLEYSSNLDGQTDIQGLCDVALAAMVRSGLFELGAIRVRAIRCEAYAIADRLPENAFLDMSLRIGTGRSPEERQAAGSLIFAAVSEYLSPLLAEPHFALSFEIREIDPVSSWKQNAMHARLRATTR